MRRLSGMLLGVQAKYRAEQIRQGKITYEPRWPLLHRILHGQLCDAIMAVVILVNVMLLCLTPHSMSLVTCAPDLSLAADRPFMIQMHKFCWGARDPAGVVYHGHIKLKRCDPADETQWFLSQWVNDRSFFRAIRPAHVSHGADLCLDGNLRQGEYLRWSHCIRYVPGSSVTIGVDDHLDPRRQWMRFITWEEPSDRDRSDSNVTRIAAGLWNINHQLYIEPRIPQRTWEDVAHLAVPKDLHEFIIDPSKQYILSAGGEKLMDFFYASSARANLRVDPDVMAKLGMSFFSNALYLNEPKATSNAFIDGFCTRPYGGMLSLSSALDMVFFIAFFAELVMWVVDRGWIWFLESRANVLHAFVVGCLFVGILPLGKAKLRTMVVLKLVPLLHWASKRWIPSLFALVQHLKTIAMTLFWVLVLIGTALTFISVCMMALVKLDSFADYDEARVLFGDFGSSIFTLVQLMTLDQWGGILEPMLLVSPMTGIVLVCVLSFLAMICTNVIVALVVEQVWQAEAAIARREQFYKRQMWMRACQGIERLLGTKAYEKDEFMERLAENKVMRRLDALEIRYDECPDLFDLFTPERCNTVRPHEFTQGIRQLRRDITRLDIREVVDKVHNISRMGKKCADGLVKVDKLMITLREEVKDIQRGSKLLSEAFERVIEVI
eukprot:GEMP01013389.1.p1 GENE.GEMP01013389.1~~GEMP01013389.1.p1  ORF type:complete len:665 (+),score=111.69 GEMP01013389.1:247-2241(+)